jgi:trigger factor
MQVSVETLSELERRVTVQIPAEQVTEEIHSRLQKLSRQVKVHGFRPGKVPLNLLKKLHGDQVRRDVVAELMQSSLQETLTQEKLNPVGNPTINGINLEEGQNLEYSATFEIVPEFELTGLENIQVERPVAEVTEQDIDAMIATLRQQRAPWSVVGRPARIGDRVLIDFKGQIDGQDFPGDKGDSTSMVLGNGTMLKDFEDQLVGLGARAETVFDLTFPADYRAAHIAGKTAQFRVKIHRVEQSVLPELDEDFAKSFDVKTGGIAGLRQSLRDNMEHELRDSIKAMVKHQALQGLLAANPIPLPQALIDAEIENLARQLHFPANAPDEQSQQRKAQLFGAEARQRVALGLLMSRVVAAQDLRADEQRVQAHLAMVATNYEEPAEVIRSYEQNPQVMENVRALVIEDRVVEWLLAQAQVTEKPGTFAEIMKPAQSQAEPADQPPSTQESAA